MIGRGKVGRGRVWQGQDRRGAAPLATAGLGQVRLGKAWLSALALLGLTPLVACAPAGIPDPIGFGVHGPLDCNIVAEWIDTYQAPQPDGGSAGHYYPVNTAGRDGYSWFRECTAGNVSRFVVQLKIPFGSPIQGIHPKRYIFLEVPVLVHGALLGRWTGPSILRSRTDWEICLLFAEDGTEITTVAP